MYSLEILSGLLHKMMTVDSCDLYYAYTGDGYFVPIKHYNPADEESLLAKYCPEKVLKNQSVRVKGREGRVSKAHEPTPLGTPKRKTPPQGSSPKPKKKPTKAQNPPSAPSTAQTQTCHPHQGPKHPPAPPQPKPKPVTPPSPKTPPQPPPQPQPKPITPPSPP